MTSPTSPPYRQSDQSDQINALTTRIGEDGYLSNLVWNTRNRYLAHPQGTFTAREVQLLVEGLLAEIATISNAPERSE